MIITIIGQRAQSLTVLSYSLLLAHLLSGGRNRRSHKALAGLSYQINGANGIKRVRFLRVPLSKPEKDVRMQKPVLTC